MRIFWPLLVQARRHPKGSLVLAVVLLAAIIGGVGSAVSSKNTASTSAVAATPAGSETTSASPSPTGSTSPTAAPTPTPTAAARLVTTATGDIEPVHALTPGEAFPAVTAAQVCVPGYSASVRNVPSSVRHAVFAAYGIPYAQHANYELDHLISLELGGDNAQANLWPEPLNGAGGAKVKDTLENKLHALVCSNQITLTEAQEAISGDWGSAYQKYSGVTLVYPTPAAPAYTPPPAPAYTPPPAPAYTPPATSGQTYTNVDGNQVPVPQSAPAAPAGATAQCSDGTYSFSQHHQGTCSHHGGVAQWL